MIGFLVAAMGLFVAFRAVGIVDSGAGMSDDTPSWVGICAGFAFVLAGAALIIGFAVAGGTGPDGDLPPGTPWGIRLTQYLLGLGITGALAAIASWIAFAPGRRTFTMTGPLLGRGHASETIGRAVFGLGAILTCIFLIVFAVVCVRRLRGRR